MSNTIFDYPELLEGDEELLHLSQACKKFRPPISRPTIERIIRIGVRDVVLRTVLVGSRRYTTSSEIKRFTLAQLQNPVPPNDEPANDIPKRPTRRASGGMTPEEVSAGLARHGLES